MRSDGPNDTTSTIRAPGSSLRRTGASDTSCQPVSVRTCGRSAGCGARPATGISEQRAESLEEALVLGLCADGDAQRSRAPERAAGAHQHAALRQPAHDLGLLAALAEIEPDEVGLRVRRLDADLAQPLLDADPLGQVALDAAGDLVLVVERLER